MLTICFTCFRLSLESGHNNQSTLSGSFSSFVAGHDLVAYILYGECDTYNTTAMSTANQSFPSTSGSGSVMPVLVSGSSDLRYCTQTCVADLDANATMGDPVGPVCGPVETYMWTSPVSSL